MSLNIVFAANIAIEVPDFPQVRQYLDMEPVKSANKNDVISAKSSIYNDKKTTAFWKDENTVKTLIHQWEQYQLLFESRVIRNDVYGQKSVMRTVEENQQYVTIYW